MQFLKKSKRVKTVYYFEKTPSQSKGGTHKKETNDML